MEVFILALELGMQASTRPTYLHIFVGEMNNDRISLLTFLIRGGTSQSLKLLPRITSEYLYFRT